MFVPYRLYSWQNIVTALLHDGMEDFDWTYEFIASMSGDVVAIDVKSLSRPPLSEKIPTTEAQEEAYLAQLNSGSVVVKIVKIFDRVDNMRTYYLYLSVPGKFERKVKETITLIPIARQVGLERELRFFLKQWLGVTVPSTEEPF